MEKREIVKAWKNAEYRETLSASEQEMLPDHPCGVVDLNDDDLTAVAGGLQKNTTFLTPSCICCH